jgi:hypothetical protein
MAGPRAYTQGTLIMLGQRSGGLCYWPGCPERVTVDIDDVSRFVLQIAHIRAAEPGGARYDAAMSDDDRRGVFNLILLCYPHHVIADDKALARTYTVEVLHRWKAQREANPREAMKRLREVTPAALAQAVAAGVERHDARVLALLDRLETRDDRETAAVVRGLVDELTEAYTRLRRTLDVDTVETFSRAVSMLHRMEFDVDAIESFEQAVDKLVKMRGTLEMFTEAMDR